ncbi:hypothetical protein NDU88_008177 [Pleurodeles waltl]|uniref:Uncharacterized protein n=1 Tax=Pleurodeles waltl TaxID=8319 RepID=A0AAV7NYE3_PLEWA|nr:hypothetical protein NDU88_008177 [Pleurodeles waltl]
MNAPINTYLPQEECHKPACKSCRIPGPQSSIRVPLGSDANKPTGLGEGLCLARWTCVRPGGWGPVRQSPLHLTDPRAPVRTCCMLLHLGWPRLRPVAPASAAAGLQPGAASSGALHGPPWQCHYREETYLTCCGGAARDCGLTNESSLPTHLVSQAFHWCCDPPA